MRADGVQRLAHDFARKVAFELDKETIFSGHVFDGTALDLGQVQPELRDTLQKLQQRAGTVRQDGAKIDLLGMSGKVFLSLFHEKKVREVPLFV